MSRSVIACACVGCATRNRINSLWSTPGGRWSPTQRNFQTANLRLTKSSASRRVMRRSQSQVNGRPSSFTRRNGRPPARLSWSGDVRQSCARIQRVGIAQATSWSAQCLCGNSAKQKKGRKKKGSITAAFSFSAHSLLFSKPWRWFSVLEQRTKFHARLTVA